MNVNEILAEFVAAKLEGKSGITLDDTTEHRYALAVLGMAYLIEDTAEPGRYDHDRDKFVRGHRGRRLVTVPRNWKAGDDHR